MQGHPQKLKQGFGIEIRFWLETSGQAPAFDLHIYGFLLFTLPALFSLELF